MRIHSDKLTTADINSATRAAGMRGVYTEDLETRGSRKRTRAFEAKLSSLHGTRRQLRRGASDSYAATWDEWGMFINALFNVDPDAIVGPYRGEDHFHKVTFDRFRSRTALHAHGNHKWRNDGTGIMLCEGCDAQFDPRAAYAKEA